MDMTKHDHTKMLTEQKNNQVENPHSTHMGHQGHHDHGDSANLLEACGYCSLLFHLNWIDAKTLELIPLKQIRYPNIITSIISHKYHVPCTSIQPRAPPALLV